MATINNKDWDYEKPINGDSQATAPNSALVQPIVLDGSLAEDNTGNTSIGYDTSKIDTSTTASKRQSVVITEEDGSTTKAYEIENPDDLGTTDEVTIWVYDSNWNTDDTEELIVYIGGGDGTDYSVDGTGANPFEQSGLNPDIIQHHNGDATDSSANGKNGTINGASYTDNQQFDGGYNFDGVDDNIDYGSPVSSVTLNGTFTVSVWIRNDDITEEGTFFQNIQGSSNRPVMNVNHSNNGELGVQIYDGNGWTQGATGSISEDTWHHVVWVMNSGTPTLYIDGAEVTGTNIGAGSDGRTQLRIGSRDGQDGTYTAFDGDIDEFEIYPSAKTSNWVDAQYQSSPKAGQQFFEVQAGSPTSPTISSSFDVAIKAEDIEVSASYDTAVALTNQETSLSMDAIVSTTGTLSGTVTLEQNAIQGAEVICYNSTDQEFVGQAITDSSTSGNYSFSGLDTQKRYFIATRYYDSNNDTRYAEAAKVILTN